MLLFLLLYVAVHLGVKMADTMSFTAKVDLVDFWISSKMQSGIVHHKSDRKSCVLPTADRNTVECQETIWSEAVYCHFSTFIDWFSVYNPIK